MAMVAATRTANILIVPRSGEMCGEVLSVMGVFLFISFWFYMFDLLNRNLCSLLKADHI